MQVYQQRVSADQIGPGGLVDVGLDRRRAHEGLAQPDQPLVGMDLHPQHVGELAEPDGFDRRDLHDATPRGDSSFDRLRMRTLL
jgi:hypothetical protein